MSKPMVMFVRSKKLVKKSQSCLFAVSSCEQKGDNVVTSEGTEKVKVMLQHSFCFFSLPSNVITLSHFLFAVINCEHT